MRFENATLFMLVLLIVIVGGFWQAYFSQLLPSGNFSSISFWTHLHLGLATAWMLLLLVQPILVRRKKMHIHRQIGRLSYVVMPLFMLSVLLLFHSRHHVNEPTLGMEFFVGCKDLCVLVVMFFCGVKFRHVPQIHARAMVATGIAFIEPALIRLLLFVFPNFASVNYLFTVLIIHAIIVSLIVLERKQTQGRWVFPLVSGMYLLLHTIVLTGARMGVMEDIARWVVSV